MPCPSNFDEFYERQPPIYGPITERQYRELGELFANAVLARLGYHEQSNPCASNMQRISS